MAFSCKVGAFNAGTGAVNSTQDITCGFQPKAIILWWSGHTSSTDSCTFGDSKWGYGFGTSGGERCAWTMTDDNGAGSQGSSYGHRDDAIIASLTVNSTTWDGMIDLDAFANWPADGFRLIVDDVMPIDLRVGFIAYGGADITDVDLHPYADAATGSPFDVAITGNFQPDVVFWLGSSSGSVAPAASATQSVSAFAVATPGPVMGCLAGGTDQGSASADTASYCGDDTVNVDLSAADPTSVSNENAFVQMNADGFRIAASTAAFRRYALCIKGGKWLVGSLQTRTDSNGIAISGLGGTPKGVLLGSAAKATEAAVTSSAPLKFSLGAATSTTERHAQSYVSQSGSGNMRVVRAVEHDEVYINITAPGSDGADDAAGTVEGLMDVSSVDADGYTFVMDDTDSSARFVWYVMAGETPATDTNSAASYHPMITRNPINVMYAPCT